MRPAESSDALAVDGCAIIDLPIIQDPRGTLTVIEGAAEVPFEVARVFYMYDVPGGSERGGHALKTAHQVLIAISGSFDVHLTNSLSRGVCHLNRPYRGLHIPPGVWRSMDNFSSNSVLLVLASERYDPDDYIRDYDDYVAYVAEVSG